MNPLLNQPSEFASLVQRFFLNRLMQQKNASPRTIEAYRDTFRLLLKFAEQRLKKSPTAFTLNDYNATLILGFLDYLEEERHNSIRTRNARLAAIHSFSRYVALQCPPALLQAQQILAIPTKRFEKPLLGFLSVGEIQALLVAPSADTWFGQRDRLMLTILYNTGARVSELIGIRVADVNSEGAPSIRLHGKGRKQRTIPLWKETVVHVRRWQQQQNLRQDQPLVPNRHGRPMTRANVSERVALAVTTAKILCPQMRGRHITPHSIRHTTAMHLLQGGVDITVIALWLGHESTTTTHGYIEMDLAMKERALAAIRSPRTKRTRYHPSGALLTFLDGL